MNLNDFMGYFDAELARQLADIVHEQCKEVPHDIGVMLALKVAERQAEKQGENMTKKKKHDGIPQKLEDGSIDVLPELRDEIEYILSKKDGVEQLMAMVTKHCQQLLAEVSRNKKTWWEKASEHYGFDFTTSDYTYSPVKGVIHVRSIGKGGNTTMNLDDLMGYFDAELARQLADIVHEQCKEVPHDIGVMLALKVAERQAEKTLKI